MTIINEIDRKINYSLLLRACFPGDWLSPGITIYRTISSNNFYIRILKSMEYVRCVPNIICEDSLNKLLRA